MLVTIQHHIVILSPSASSGQVQRRICAQPNALRVERDASSSSQHDNLEGVMFMERTEG